MPLLKPNGFVNDDWTILNGEEALPAGGDIALPWPRLQRDWDSLAKHDGRLGVLFPNNEKVAQLRLYLPRLALVALNFPAFNDGRSLSIARQLRLEGYSGEIRATGNVLPDQLQFMLQVGFDSFEVSERFTGQRWIDSLKRMSLTYQHDLADAKTTQGAAAVWKARHGPTATPTGRKNAG
ncbi:MAG: DUF934 domain-containing protein [Aestuariivirgaceae bacterium]